MPGYKLRIWDGERQYYGSNPAATHKSPGRSKFDSITLERGVVEDGGFADWAANLVGNVASYREGNTTAPQKFPGRSKFDSITLERGVTQDSSFANWASGIGTSAGAEASPQNFPKHIFVDFYNDAGQLIVNYRFSNGWVFEQPVVPRGGVRLHNLHLRNGNTTQEKLSAIFRESLSRLSGGS